MSEVESFTVPAWRLGCHVEVAVEDGRVRAARFVREPSRGEARSPAARQVRELLEAHLDKGATDLTGVPVDLTGVPPFHRVVLETLRQVPAGKTVTYGQLAALVGRPGAARAVGEAMRRNPIPVLVPCHRVLAANGKVGNYSGLGGEATKRRLLAIEGAL